MSHNADTQDGTIVVDGHRIDRASQVILTRLNESEWMYATKLREAAELSQNTQVFYRMEEHLIPAGFVEEAEREENGTEYQERRQFRLTAAGAAWLDDHVEDVAMPKSRVETQQMAYEAQEAAESAKDSVQSYRKKLHRLKDGVEDAFDSVSDDIDEHDSRLMDVESLSSSNDYGNDILSSRVDEIEERVSTVENDHEDATEWTRKRFKSQQEEIGELQANLSAVEEEAAELRAEVEEMQRSWLDRLREWLA